MVQAYKPYITREIICRHPFSKVCGPCFGAHALDHVQVKYKALVTQLPYQVSNPNDISIFSIMKTLGMFFEACSKILGNCLFQLNNTSSLPKHAQNKKKII